MPQSDKYSVMILGKGGSGKTSLIKRMKRETVGVEDEAIRTVGLNTSPVRIHGYDIMFYDTAGDKDVTDKWSLHFGKVQGFIFALDSTDRRECKDTSAQLEKFLEHPDVRDKPVLLVATKMDVDGALDEEVVSNVYDLDKMIEEYRNVRYSATELSFSDGKDDDNHANPNSQISVNHQDDFDIPYDGRPQKMPLALCPQMLNQRVSVVPAIESHATERNAHCEEEKKGKPDANDVFEKRNGNINTNVHHGETHNCTALEVNGRKKTSSYSLEFSHYTSDRGDNDNDSSNSMSFRVGTIWLMDEIEANKVEINKRIQRYMDTHGSKVSKSLKSLTKLQKQWEKEHVSTGTSRKVSKEMVSDTEGPDWQKIRKSVRASDSADKLTNFLQSNENRFCGQDSCSRPHKTSLMSGRLSGGEEVRSKRGIRFRESVGIN